MVSTSVVIPAKLVQTAAACAAGFYSGTFYSEKIANYVLAAVALTQFIDASIINLEKMVCTTDSPQALCLLYFYLPLIYAAGLTLVGLIGEVNKADEAAAQHGGEVPGAENVALQVVEHPAGGEQPHDPEAQHVAAP